LTPPTAEDCVALFRLKTFRGNGKLDPPDCKIWLFEGVTKPLVKLTFPLFLPFANLEGENMLDPKSVKEFCCAKTGQNKLVN